MGLSSAAVDNIKQEAKYATWLWATASFLSKGDTFDTTSYEIMNTAFVWNGLQETLQTRADKEGASNGINQQSDRT